MADRDNSVLLFSGGIDSFVAYHYLNKPKTVYFDVQSRYTQRELEVVKRLIPSTIIDHSLDFSSREIGVNAYIPFRNLLLAAQAAKYADTIYIVGIKGDNVSDKNEEIFEEFSTLLTKLENRPIKVLSPFWEKTKSEIISWYLNDHKGNLGILLQTISCYAPKATGSYCGRCPSCFRKWTALRANGINVPFYNDALLDEYYKAAKKGIYIKERNDEIIREIDAYRSGH